MDRRRRRLRVGQLVIAEVALVGVVVASVGPAWLLFGVAAAATAVFVATFGRSGGRWWYEAVASHRRFARRRRRAAADVVGATLAGRTPPALVWLRTLAPELTMRSMIAADTVVGVGADGTGWFGAVAVEPRAPELAEVATLIGTGPDRIALSHAQVVRRGARTWVALRLSPVDAVEAERAGGRSGAGGQAAAEPRVRGGGARPRQFARRAGGGERAGRRTTGALVGVAVGNARPHHVRGVGLAARTAAGRARAVGSHRVVRPGRGGR
jgi:hypothetical protein